MKENFFLVSSISGDPFFMIETKSKCLLVRLVSNLVAREVTFNMSHCTNLLHYVHSVASRVHLQLMQAEVILWSDDGYHSDHNQGGIMNYDCNRTSSFLT